MPRTSTNPAFRKSTSKPSRSTSLTSTTQTPEQLSQAISKSIQCLSIQHAYDYLDKLQDLIDGMKDAYLDSGAVVSRVHEDPDEWTAEDLGEDEDGEEWADEGDDDEEGNEGE